MPCYCGGCAPEPHRRPARWRSLGRPAPSAPTFPPSGLIAEFCDRLVAHDLPDLPTDRRADVVAFIGHRIDHLPSPMGLGVGMVASLVGAAGRIAGTGRVAAVLARHPLPVLGEYVRLLRSLAYAYVWDTWPDTTVSGRAREAQPG